MPYLRPSRHRRNRSVAARPLLAVHRQPDMHHTEAGRWAANLAYDPEALQRVAEKTSGSARMAFHVAHRIARHPRSGDGVLSPDVADSLVERLQLDDSDFTNADWLLLDWAVDAADDRFGTQSNLPRVKLIASTSVAWTDGRDFADTFGSLRSLFASTLAMPQVHSTNDRMLALELDEVPVISAE